MLSSSSTTAPTTSSSSPATVAAGNAVALQAATARHIVIPDLADVGTTPLGTSLPASVLNGLGDRFNAELSPSCRPRADDLNRP
ncbi:hypothetical protein [Pseudomonas lopnurensis]|uniref:hypothetical protein n=1 Tax=Pseudomonas lopnurensis TaxID=1477517 RepID=UPI001879FE95|nr:hypothetical protein [Pseudomonas lopnurensis]MBE7376366.1 hypothetical protein [Pseudomonas lopnurensis]